MVAGVYRLSGSFNGDLQEGLFQDWFLFIYLVIYLFILLWLCSSCHLSVFGHVVSFFVHSSILLLMVVQQLVVVLELSQEERNASPSTQPYWTRSLKFFLLLWRDLYYLTQENLVVVFFFFFIYSWHFYCFWSFIPNGAFEHPLLNPPYAECEYYYINWKTCILYISFMVQL